MENDRYASGQCRHESTRRPGKTSRGIINDSTMHFRMLRARIWNDLLIDLDKTLLCPDENSRSRTDPMEFRQLLHESTGNASILLGEITKCYEDASLLLRER